MAPKSSLLVFFLVLSSMFAAAPAHATWFSDWMFKGPSVKVQPEGRYITYRYSLWKLHDDQERGKLIDDSVALLVADLKQRLASDPKNATLSNKIFSSKLMSDLSVSAQQTVGLIMSPFNHQMVYPTALMVRVGGSIGAAWGGKVKGGADLGFIMFPEKIVMVDTETGETSYKNSFDLSVVAIPHGEIGIGAVAEAGPGVTFGFYGVWGDMTSAEDVTGATGGLAGDIKALGGIDFNGFTIVSLHHIYPIFGFTYDVGAEAGVSVDGEGGLVLPLSHFLKVQ